MASGSSWSRFPPTTLSGGTRDRFTSKMTTGMQMRMVRAARADSKTTSVIIRKQRQVTTAGLASTRLWQRSAYRPVTQVRPPGRGHA